MRFLQNEEGSAGDATSNGATAAGDAAGVNLADAMKDPGAALNDAQGWLSENMPRLIEWGVQIVGVLIILVLAWIVAGWASRITRRTLTRANLDLTLTRFFGKLVKYAILIAAIIACLGQFGFEMTTFAAVIAAAGFAVGLAFQGTLSNFSAGVMLLAFRPFKVDDVVNIGGVTGKVF